VLRLLALNRRLWIVLGLAFAIITVGTVGYIVIEGWNWQDALFMTVITLSTVGYGETRPLDPSGRLFTGGLILLGVGGTAYTLSALTQYVIAGELNEILRRQRMTRAIQKLRNHYIICGYGRVGQQVVEGLRANRYSVIVIDNDPVHTPHLELLGVHHIVGDASEDTTLQEAGIEHASGLCACLPTDANNVFVVLSARTLNPKLLIIARSNLPESERKLRIAGANQVINPYAITGHRMAAQLLHPSVVEFLDVVMRQGELELRIEEIKIAPKSIMVGKTLTDCRVRQETGVNVLAVRRFDGQLSIDQGSDFTMKTGDTLISLGTDAQLAALAKRAGDERHALRIK